MRRLPFVISLALAAAGCAGTQLHGGQPVLVKSPDGVLISGAQGLPDLDRGNQERLAGRYEEAKRDLIPLAERGYPEAQLALAATYSRLDTFGGDREAIRWYRAALPKRPDAALTLAGLLINSGVRNDALEARRLIQGAQAEHNELARPVLLALYNAYPDFDTKGVAPTLAAAASRSALPDDRIAAIEWYRTNLADGDHAQQLQKLCRDNLVIEPDCYVDLAHFLRYQGNTKGLDALVTRALVAFEKGFPPPEPTALYRVPTGIAAVASGLATAMVDQPDVEDVPGVYETFLTQAQYDDLSARAETEDGADLARPDAVASPTTPEGPPTPPSNAALDQADRVLRWMLKQKGEFPAQAAGITVRFPFLLPDVDVVSVLLPAVAAGQHAAQASLGELYLFGLRTPLDARGAEKNLLASLAYPSTHLRATRRLGHLYRAGWLGQPDPQKAVDHILESARSGNGKAYAELAQLYFATLGFRVNRVNAYVFARRAEDSGFPVILRTRLIPRLSAPSQSTANVPRVAGAQLGVEVPYKLLDRLRVELSETERRTADAIYEAERAVHPLLRPPLPADIYSRTPS